MTRVAIAGLGAIGRVLARRLHEGIPGLTLAGAAARDRAKAQAWLDAQRIACPLLELADMPAHADLVVECAPAAAIERYLPPDAASGQSGDGPQRRRAARASASDGARRGQWRADHRADRRAARPRCRHRRGGRQDCVGPHDHPQAAQWPCGRALPGGQRHSVEGLNAPSLCSPATRGKRPPASRPTSTSPRPCRSPASGPEETTIEIWADPTVDRNCHTIEVEADSARFSLTIENVPSENPKTGKITALSVLAALRKLHAPLRVGT